MPLSAHLLATGSKLTFSTNLFHHSLLAPTWTRVGNGSRGVTHDPLTHLNRDPPLVTHDPSQLLLHTGTHTIKSSHADVFMTALAWPQYISLQNLRQRVYHKSAGCEWFESESVWCVSWSVRDRYWRWHWSVAQTSSCLHSSYRMTVFNIHHDIN